MTLGHRLHIRRLPGRPGSLADRVWSRADRTLRPLHRARLLKRLEGVPGGAGLALEPIDLAPLDSLPEALRGSARQIVREADSILSHRMQFVSSDLHDYGDPIRWAEDPLTGYEWPTAWFDSIDFGRPDMGRDVIRVWELSRGHQLLTLARASRLNPENADSYLREMADQMTGWIGANPVGRSVNWGNAMEAAIRATNWIWALRIAGPGNLPAETESLVTSSLQEHGRFIDSNLEGTPWRRNNHYIADLMGLAVLGSAVTGDPEAERWSDRATRLLGKEVDTQIYEDGLSFESSSSYQGLVLEMLAIAIDALERTGRVIPPAARGRVAAMVSASTAIRHPDGRAAQFGDSDSGRVLPAGFSREPTLDPVIWLASALLDCGRPLDGEPDPVVAWTIGLDRWQVLAGESFPGTTPPRSFPDGGIEVLESEGGKTVINCTPVGQHGQGGHAHSDALSFEWSVNGHTFVVDPGTWCYTPSLADRNLMRSTAAHATPMIDLAEINPVEPGRVFHLTDTGRPTVLERDETDSAIVVLASHPGYARLGDPVSVKRRFELDRLGRELRITDQLTGTGLHSWSIPLPLAPDWGLELEAEGMARAFGPGGSVVIEYDGPGSIEAEDYLYSPGYGVRVTARRLVFSGRGSLPVTIFMKARAG